MIGVSGKGDRWNSGRALIVYVGLTQKTQFLKLLEESASYHLNKREPKLEFAR
jgi:hypothetical protein